MKVKIEIKTVGGSVLFSFEKGNNTIRDTLERAVKSGANLRGAYLRGANLTDANLTDAYLTDADLTDADLNGAYLRGANLRGAYLRGANLNDANLTDAYLRGAYLTDAYLRGANLTDAYLNGANLTDAYLNGANLTDAYLNGAYLNGADLRGANLNGAYLTDAYLTDAYLNGADLRGANLRGANLRGHDEKTLPVQYINLCSRDMLFVFEHLKHELPYLREKLMKGQVNGSQYEGECACLIGSLGKGNKECVAKVVKTIPYYDMGTHNYGEQWFLAIKEGDTPKNSFFVKHAIKLIDSVLQNDEVVS